MLDKEVSLWARNVAKPVDPDLYLRSVKAANVEAVDESRFALSLQDHQVLTWCSVIAFGSDQAAVCYTVLDESTPMGINIHGHTLSIHEEVED